MPEQNQIFKDLKVVELASVLAGPAAGMFFAELGAEVIKVESPTGGDVTRSWKNPNENKNEAASAYYYAVNWNKKVVKLDLKNNNDQIKLHSLIAEADVLITNFKSGDVIKFNLSSQALQEKYPTLIIGEITGYPDSSKVAFDAVLQAETGFMSLNGNASSGPLKMPVALIDILAAHQLKEGILLGLLNRYKNNKGCVVKVSLFDAAISSLANQASNWLNSQYESPRMGSLHPNIAPYGETFLTQDKRLILLAVGNDKQYESFCKLIGKEELVADVRFSFNSNRVINRAELSLIIADKIAEENLEHWLVLFEQNKIPAGAVNSISEVFALNAANKKILEQEEDGRISKRVETIAFTIQYGN